MSNTFAVYEDLATFVDKDWLENIFICSGVFDDDKFSVYDKRQAFDVNQIQHVQIKNGYFNEPSFVLVCNKICQLFCIGSNAVRNQFHVISFYGINADFIQCSPTGLINSTLKNIKSFEYLQNNGCSIYYFPYNGIKTKSFFSFIQLSKDEYLVDNINGQINDKNMRKITDKAILKMIFEDCMQIKGGD